MLLAIAVLSVSPVRPSLGFHGKFDAALAFAIMGGMFGAAYPRQLITMLWIVLLLAGGLELAQLLTSGRHGHLRDAEIKAVAGAMGIGLGMIVTLAARRLRKQ